MRMTARQRHEFQQAMTLDEVEAVLARIEEIGPHDGDRLATPTEMHIPVPSGPIEHW